MSGSFGFSACWTMFHAIYANCLSLINSKEQHEILTAMLLRIKKPCGIQWCRSVRSSTFQTILPSACAGPSSPRTSTAWTSTRRLDPEDKELRSFEMSETVQDSTHRTARCFVFGRWRTLRSWRTGQWVRRRGVECNFSVKRTTVLTEAERTRPDMTLHQ